jgi:hypothetical protein
LKGATRESINQPEGDPQEEEEDKEEDPFADLDKQ